MNFLKKHVEPIVIGISIFFLLSATYVPMWQNALRAPPDRVYLGFEEYPIDYVWGMDIMRQGFNGHSGMFLQFSTTLPENRGFIKLEYLFLGRMARVLGMDLVAMFHVARFLISVMFLFFIYVLVRYVFSDKITRIVAYLFVLFGTGLSGFPKATELLGSAHDAQVFQRITDASLHHILGGLLSLVSIYFLSRSFQTPKSHNFFIVSVVTGMVAALVFPPAMILVLLSLPVAWILSVALRLKNKKVGNWHMGKLVTYVGLCTIPMLYVRYVTSVLWAPHNFSHNEELNPFSVPVLYYPIVMGGTYLLSFISVPIVVRKPSVFLLLLLPWVVLHPIAEYVISPVISINRIRFFLIPYYVPFGILATVTVREAGRVLSRRIHRIPSYIWVLGFVLLTLSLSWRSYVVSHNTSRVAFWLDNNFTFGYPRKDLVAAMEWLQKNTKESDVVLTHLYTGNMVPAFSGNRIVTSWWHRLAESPGYYPLFVQVEEFYRGSMTEAQARDFLQRHNVAYVLYSDSERLAWAATLSYPFLTQVYSGGSAIVYGVVH